MLEDHSCLFVYFAKMAQSGRVRSLSAFLLRIPVRTRRTAAGGGPSRPGMGRRRWPQLVSAGTGLADTVRQASGEPAASFGSRSLARARSSLRRAMSIHASNRRTQMALDAAKSRMIRICGRRRP